MSKWPLIKIIPMKTDFRFVAFARLAGAISILLAVGSLAMTLLPFEPRSSRPTPRSERSSHTSETSRIRGTPPTPRR